MQTLKPSTTPLIAGTYHGTLPYWPDHPSQKMPMTKLVQPTMAPLRRSSGGGNPRQVLMSVGVLRARYMSIAVPKAQPMPTERNTSPSCPIVKLRLANIIGKAWNTGWGEVGQINIHLRTEVERADARA
jgi:hypothetical protein